MAMRSHLLVEVYTPCHYLVCGGRRQMYVAYLMESGHNLPMTPSHEHVEVILGLQGRLVIPAVLRKDLGLTPGTTMVARIEDNRLILEKPDAIWARIEGRFSPVPSTVHLADELIAERREMAKKENQA